MGWVTWPKNGEGFVQKVKGNSEGGDATEEQKDVKIEIVKIPKNDFKLTTMAYLSNAVSLSYIQKENSAMK